MPDELKPVLARQMEIYAGFAEHADHHIGRLVDALEELGVLEDTLVSTCSATTAPRPRERSTARSTRCSSSTAPPPGDRRVHGRAIDKFGGPKTYNHYPVGWAQAMNTPYQWTKQVASHFGGTRDGTIVHWPSGIEAKGEMRTSSTT